MDKKLENFERSFSDCTATDFGQCACGVYYYNDDIDCDPDEIKRLEDAGEEVVRQDYSSGYVTFDGSHYLNTCDCWKEKAEKYMNWLDHYRIHVADYYALEKDRLLREANALADVG